MLGATLDPATWGDCGPESFLDLDLRTSSIKEKNTSKLRPAILGWAIWCTIGEIGLPSAPCSMEHQRLRPIMTAKTSCFRVSEPASQNKEPISMSFKAPGSHWHLCPVVHYRSNQYHGKLSSSRTAEWLTLNERLLFIDYPITKMENLGNDWLALVAVKLLRNEKYKALQLTGPQISIFSKVQSTAHSLSVLPRLTDLCHVCLVWGQSTIITYAPTCSQIAQMVGDCYESKLAWSPVMPRVNWAAFYLCTSTSGPALGQ